MRYDSDKTTLSVATPTKYSIFSADEPRDAMQHDTFKPTPSVVTPT
jgi:hypothetical protein